MNFMADVLEKLYKYGNVSFGTKEGSLQTTFYFDEDDKLKVKIEELDEFDVSTVEETDDEITINLNLHYFVVDSLYAEPQYIKYLKHTETNQGINEVRRKGIEKVYKIFMSALSFDSKKIRCMAARENLYSVLVNYPKATYDNKEEKNLSIQEMIKKINDSLRRFLFELNNEQSKYRDSRDGKNEKKTNGNDLYLNELGIHYEFLTEKDYEIDPSIDCEETIKNLEIALLTASRSAMIVGHPGVGKTAVVEGFAYRIKNGNVPNALRNKRILKINTASIVAGCSLVGMFEDKVEKLMKYLKDNPDTILFLDEIHTAIGAGTGSKSELDMANIIKPYLDRGAIKIIGATTIEEYYKYIQQDKAFERRFITVNVDEPQNITVYKIIEGTIVKLEKHHGVNWLLDEVTTRIIINTIIECTNEKHRIYNNKRYNPDLSISILEEAFAIALLRDSAKISVSDVAEAIERCPFIYETIRLEIASELQKLESEKEYIRAKIIPFSRFVTS